MTRYELRRIAQMYGATEDEVKAAEHEAVRAPLTPLGPIIAAVVHVLVEEALDAGQPDAHR